MTGLEDTESSIAKSTPPRFAIVVATRDRGNKIVQLVESVLKSDVSEFELIIVDQSSNDTTRQAVSAFLTDKRIRYLHSTLHGASRARNLGVSKTTGIIIVITDDDCIVPSNWLSTLDAPFQRYPDVGVVFCSVAPLEVRENGWTPQALFTENRLFSTLTEFWQRSRHSFALGAGMAIRRSTFTDVRGFDELLGPGAKFGSAEDNDLSWRGLLQGWQTYLCADVVVVHDGFRTPDELRLLLDRDLYGLGGALSKYLRAGRWDAAKLVASVVIRLGATEPAKQLMAGHWPRGFRRPYMLLRGIVDGLRTPMLHHSKLFVCNSSLANPGRHDVGAVER